VFWYIYACLCVLQSRIGDESDGMTDGETAGLTIGLIAAAALVGLAVAWRIKKNRANNQDAPQEVPMHDIA
jgi:hypothetical protein